MNIKNIERSIEQALIEDLDGLAASNDITAQLIPAERVSTATVICRERAIIAGRPWVDAAFNAVDPTLEITWLISEGQWCRPDQVLFTLQGRARSILTAERIALNFLQTLSGTATICRTYADKVSSTQVKLLDTRKTLPGLRDAQKYAVTVGGCFNHRIGLYDAFLIKENHIAACGGISNAIKQARNISPQAPVEIEVENKAELAEALKAGADIVMLDNFTPAEIIKAVELTSGQAKLEASGDITNHNLLAYAQTGVDYISIGALTKHCRAIDLSLRLEPQP